MRKLTMSLAAAAVLTLASCGDEKAERGLEVLPDMFHSPAHESQTAMVSPSGKQSPVMMPPVEGTVSRSLVPYAVAPTDWASAKRLVNPLTPTAEVLRVGQRGYQVTCAVCHGRDGNASHGNMAKFFSGVPSVNGANIINLTDGEIYHIISQGRNGRMPQFQAQLPPLERWATVTYVRALARASLAKKAVEEVVGDAESVLKTNPEDAHAKAAMAENRPILEQRAADLAAILALGTPEDAHHAAAAFQPLPEPIPEYVRPTWGEPGAEGAGGHKGH